MQKEELVEAIKHQMTLEVLNDMAPGFGITQKLSRWEDATAALLKLRVADLTAILCRTVEFGHSHLYVFQSRLNDRPCNNTVTQIAASNFESLGEADFNVSLIETSASENKIFGVVSFRRRLIPTQGDAVEFRNQTFHLPFQIEANNTDIIKIHVGIFNPRTYIGLQSQEKFQFVGTAQFPDDEFAAVVADRVAASRSGMNLETINLSRAVRALVQNDMVTAKRVDYHDETGAYGYLATKHNIDKEFCPCQWLKDRIGPATKLGKTTWFFLKIRNRVPSKNDGMEYVSIDPENGMMSFTRSQISGWEHRIDTILNSNS